MESRTYLIIPFSEIPKLNFDLICETSEETLRKTNDGLKTLIKWDNDQPEFISSLNNTEGPYNKEEILEILRQSEWNDPLE